MPAYNTDNITLLLGSGQILRRDVGIIHSIDANRFIGVNLHIIVC